VSNLENGIAFLKARIFARVPIGLAMRLVVILFPQRLFGG